MTCPVCGGAGIVDTSPPGVETAPSEWPMSLEDVQRIVGHLIHDGTREGLICGGLLNSAMGASARRRAALRGEGA